MGTRLSQQEFLRRARAIHGDTYDYTHTVFVRTSDKVTVGCRTHGPFTQNPSDHMSGHGCGACSGRHALSVEAFINRSRSVHGDRYDYSQVIYRDQKSKVVIVCAEHGAFEQRAQGHLLGYGCRPCGIRLAAEKRRLPYASFLARAQVRHGDRYRYAEGGYWIAPGLVRVECEMHGPFDQDVSNHLQGANCPRCGREAVREAQATGRDRFIEQAVAVHGERYDYSHVRYVNAGTRVTITCTAHGPFPQKPNDHLAGKGCAACANKRQLTTEEFIARARVRHGEKYDYSQVEYCNSAGKVLIGCREHGVFPQAASSHLLGTACPRCKESQGERVVRRVLESHGVDFIAQFSHPTLRDRGLLLVDFAVPARRLLIEFDGTQHRRPVQFGGMTQVRRGRHSR